MYARIMRERFGASDASARLRFHTQTGGVTLQAQQPLNNVVRVTVQALAAVLGGTQSLHTNGYDEALSLPTAEAATLALRTQQIIAHESGAALTADPLGGSYYVEHLTNALEAGAGALLARVDALGGAAKAIAASFFQDEIAKSAYEHQLRVERGETVIVGVNKFTDDSEALEIPSPDYTALARDQVARLAAVRGGREDTRVAASLDALARSAQGYVDARSRERPAVMPLLIEAVRARASVGEISNVLSAQWGTYHPS
jgi:methylmalonyl-CoA mutase N-terminal domain/subunit